MYIKEIHVKKFRHLEDVRIGPFSIPSGSSDLVVLAGPNGGGKSSVLELLGFALSNLWSLSWELRRSFAQYAFEVTLALTQNERTQVRAFLAERSSDQDVAAHFEDDSVYYRSFKYPEGRYAQRQEFYDRVHNVVSQALRHPERLGLGFFLKSDRSYPQESFQQNRLFQYSNMMTLGHLRSLAFTTSDSQYRDMFDFLVQQRYHYFRRLGAHHHKIAVSQLVTEKPPDDPLQPYDELLQRLFPGYCFSDKNEETPSNLFVEIPSGDVVPFQDLSSGEKEVFFILSFFLRHQVTNSIILIDEPELHLHPDFARLLIRTMQTIQPGNQIWLATHNPEIIDEAGRDRVIYVARDTVTNKSKITKATEESEALRVMKEMFGFSGYIGIAKRMVFLEGDNTSSDRKVFSNVFPQYGSSIKFIPANSSENQARLNAAILNILESDLGWAQFYLLRDRDYLPPEMVKKYNEHKTGRIYVLKRHEIENYLLDEEQIAKVQSELFGRPKDAAHVKSRLRSIARRISGEVLRDMIAFRLNLKYRPQDFSLGEILTNQQIVDESGNVQEDRIGHLKNQLSSKVLDINTSLQKATAQTALDELVNQCQGEVLSAIREESNGWKETFPGKELLEAYAKSEGLGDPVVLHNALVKEMAASPEFIPQELMDIIRKIVDGNALTT